MTDADLKELREKFEACNEARDALHDVESDDDAHEMDVHHVRLDAARAMEELEDGLRRNAPALLARAEAFQRIRAAIGDGGYRACGALEVVVDEVEAAERNGS